VVVKIGDEYKTFPAHLTVLQPDRRRELIPTFDVSDPSKMLGIHFVPKGDGAPHLTECAKKAWTGSSLSKLAHFLLATLGLASTSS